MKDTTVNISLKLRALLALLFIAMTTGCMKIDEITGADNFNKQNDNLSLRRYSGVPLNLPPLVQFILDKKDIESLMLNGNMRKVCDYTKIPFQSVTVEEWNANPKIGDNVSVLSLLNTKKLNTKPVVITKGLSLGFCAKFSAMVYAFS